MRFDRIKISNFRNISSAEVNTEAEDIVLTGTNGQGKTSFIEAVYNLCYGSSFRTSFLREEIKHGTDSFFISGEYKNEYGGKEAVSIGFGRGKRVITVAGREVKDRKELIYLFPCIAFVHSDIDFVTGEPEVRRRFFDQMMTLHSPAFFDELRLYRGILMQRNAAVKLGDTELLHLYDKRLVRLGLGIMKERAAAVYDFNQIFPPLFSQISGVGMRIDISYQPSWGAFGTAEEIEEYLMSTTERDLKLQTTTSGTHRDRFTVMSPMGQFQNIGSTGQIRLCSILLRVAEAAYFRKMTGTKPIMLVDDVLLELDQEKRAAVLSSLSGYSQAFYTFLPGESYFSEKRGIGYDVAGGEFRCQE